jgi:hypothetical protein
MRFNIPSKVVWTDEIKSLRTLTEVRVSKRFAEKLALEEEEEQRRKREGDSEPRVIGGRLQQKRLQFSNDGALTDNMIEIELDIRRPLIDLKREISRIIGIPVEKFKLRNVPAVWLLLLYSFIIIWYNVRVCNMLIGYRVKRLNTWYSSVWIGWLYLG